MANPGDRVVRKTPERVYLTKSSPTIHQVLGYPIGTYLRTLVFDLVPWNREPIFISSIGL